MDLNTILKLLDAGYTKADIDAMTASPVSEPAAVPEPEPVKPAEETAAEPDQITSADVLNNLLAEVKGLKAQIQANNIKNDSMGSKPEVTAESILASLINSQKEG